MIQDRIFKIIKGLNTFSPDDLMVMADIDEIEAEAIIANLIKNGKIVFLEKNKFKYQQKSKKMTFSLIEKQKKNSKICKNIYFFEAAEYFLSNYAKNNCTPSTFKTYKTITKTHLIPFFGKMKLSEITKDEIMKFIEFKQKNENISNKHLNNCITLFGNIFKKFVEWELISESPYCGIINVKFEKKAKIHILKESETSELLKTAKTKYFCIYPIILLILSAGLKKAEILALQKQDIDLKNRKINVTKTYYEGKILVPKTKTTIRKINFPENISLELENILENKKDEDFIFCNLRLSPFSMEKKMRKSFLNLLEILQLQKMNFDDLRHTYACNALQQGISIDCLHKQLGDYSIQSTMDKYRDFIKQ